VATPGAAAAPRRKNQSPNSPLALNAPGLGWRRAQRPTTTKWLRFSSRRAPATTPGLATESEPPQNSSLPVARIRWHRTHVAATTRGRRRSRLWNSICLRCVRHGRPDLARRLAALLRWRGWRSGASSSSPSWFVRRARPACYRPPGRSCVDAPSREIRARAHLTAWRRGQRRFSSYRQRHEPRWSEARCSHSPSHVPRRVTLRSESLSSGRRTGRDSHRAPRMSTPSRSRR